MPSIGRAQTGAQAVPICFGQPATILGTGGQVDGTPGDDVIVGSDGVDHVDAYEGDDRICVGKGNEFSVDAGPGRDRISGGPGWDDLTGGAGHDLIRGGPGDDVLRDGRGNDVLQGGPGRDRLGGYGGHQGSDTARGGPGRDELVVFGNDRLDGGRGRDLLQSGGRTGVVLDLSAPTLRSIESVRGTDRNDVLIGDGRNNLFIPVYGDDRIDGKGGRDTAFFDRFEDFIETGLTIDLTAGTATGAGDDILSGIEDVIGSEGPDVILGDAGRNRLFGFYGDDVLKGLDGEDVLDGDVRVGRSKHERNDSADGGAGNDACVDVEERINCESFRAAAFVRRWLSVFTNEDHR